MRSFKVEFVISNRQLLCQDKIFFAGNMVPLFSARLVSPFCS